MLEKYITVALEKASEDDGKFEEEDAGFSQGEDELCGYFRWSPRTWLSHNAARLLVPL